MADSGGSRPRSAIRSVSAPRPATPPIPSSTPPSSSSRCGPHPASSGGHLPAKGTNSHTACERGKPTNRDVGKLVDAYRNILLLSWPLILFHEFISAVFSWEYPLLTFGIWITLQLFFFYMTTGQLLVMCFLMLFVIACLGYLSYTSQQLTEKHNSSKKQNFGIHLTTNSTSSSSISSSSSSSSSTSPPASSHGTTSCSTNQKVTRGGDSQKAKIPVTSSPPKNTIASTSLPSSSPKGDGCLATSHHDKKKHVELEVESHRRRELLTEYRQMMQDLSRWLTTVSSMLLRVEEMLLWRCRWKTIIFYLTLHIGVLCVMYLPFRWITMATTNSLLLAHPQCYKGFEKMKKWVTSKIYPEDMSQDESSNHLNNSQDKEHGSHLHKDGVVSSHPLEDLNANEDTDEEVQGEIRKRGTQILVPPSLGLDGPVSNQQHHQPKKFESGMCYLCGTLFTSVLKRRRYCRYCGRDFCPKCCSKKLPRSLLGATAPAAQTEKELVCNLCIIKLTGEEVGGSKVR